MWSLPTSCTLPVLLPLVSITSISSFVVAPCLCLDTGASEAGGFTFAMATVAVASANERSTRFGRAWFFVDMARAGRGYRRFDQRPDSEPHRGVAQEVIVSRVRIEDDEIVTPNGSTSAET
jgi:hypothetical protein